MIFETRGNRSALLAVLEFHVRFAPGEGPRDASTWLVLLPSKVVKYRERKPGCLQALQIAYVVYKGLSTYSSKSEDRDLLRLWDRLSQKVLSNRRRVRYVGRNQFEFPPNAASPCGVGNSTDAFCHLCSTSVVSPKSIGVESHFRFWTRCRRIPVSC